MASKVAVVTGANKGIGFAIVRGLCKQFNGDVYLTARDQTRGIQAVEELKKEGLNPKFHQLDIEDNKSIETLKNFLKSNYGGLDLLVNNAAIAFKQDSDAPFPVQAETTIRVNFTCLLNVCNELFPILKPGARVVHVSSTASHYFLQRCSQENCKRLQTANNMEQVLALIREFEQDAKENKHKEKGWPESAYGASKIGVTMVTPIQQATMDKERPDSDIVINCCCPGYVNTDMTSHKGPLTIDQGAETPLYLALLPAGEKAVRGCFVAKKTVFDWKNGKYNSLV